VEMDDGTIEFVRNRAGNRCEFCRLPQTGHEERFSIDHIIARKHGGSDNPRNLALCCLSCNLHKGTDLTSIDPETGAVVRLFNPRTDKWEDHFELQSAKLVGRTSSGRATVILLNMNAPERIRLREVLGVRN